MCNKEKKINMNFYSVCSRKMANKSLLSRVQFDQLLENVNEFIQTEWLPVNYKTDLNKPKNNSNIDVILREPCSKYPLENSWTFWYFKNNREAEWKDNLTPLATVEFVEDFWSVYEHLLPVEQLSDGMDYMLFKKGIQPMWEDAHNLNGGRWLFTIEKKTPTKRLMELWLNALISLIGSHYDEESALVNGTVLNIRHKVNKIALWTNESSNTLAQNRIGKRFKKTLDIQMPINFEAHNKAELVSVTETTDEHKTDHKTRENNSMSIQNAFIVATNSYNKQK